MTHDESDTQLVRVAQLALRAGRRHLADYACRKSRKDFTQPQLLACLVLKAVARTDYRGVCELLRVSPALREAIGLRKVPHWTTLQKFMARPEIPLIVDAALGAVLELLELTDTPVEAAADSTGLQNGVASLHFASKRWKNGPGLVQQCVKVSVVVLCGVLLPAALVVDLGSSADMKQMPALMAQLGDRVRVSALYADAGYDAEWVHEVCREEWGAASYIPPVVRTADGSIKTKYRSLMRELPSAFGRRWHVESFFSGLKRTMLSTLSSRKPNTLIAEASIKVLAYAIRR